jgi:curved DNA-binding protein CbpA
MATLPDHYRALQVLPEAEHEVIRAAYRALAAKYHPDVSGGSTRRMSALNAAWAVLGDAKTRKAYDDRRLAAMARASARASRPREASPSPTSQPRPVSRPTGRHADGSSTLDFGRFVGWSIREVARHDPNYLEWLIRTPTGRRFHAEVQAVLAAQAAPSTPEPMRRSRFSRF